MEDAGVLAQSPTCALWSISQNITEATEVAQNGHWSEFIDYMADFHHSLYMVQQHKARWLSNTGGKMRHPYLTHRMAEHNPWSSVSFCSGDVQPKYDYRRLHS